MQQLRSTRPRFNHYLALWWSVARQWFTGTDRWEARLYVVACAVLALISTWLSVQISYAQKRFSTALADHNKAAWLGAVWEFVSIICLAAPLKALNVYAEKRLVTVWRAALTQAFITAYTSNRTYFHLQLARATEGDQADGITAATQQQQARGSAEVDAGGPAQQMSSTEGGIWSSVGANIDNPDQRITADVSNYVSTSVTLVLLLGRKLLNCAAFTGVLWSISPKLVTFLLCYAFMGTFGTAFFFGRPFTVLQQKILKLEADLRFGLVRLRENAEAIAFYKGDAQEAADLSSRLSAMITVLLKRIRWLGLYELWVHVYSYATILIPSLVLAPDYFAGKIEFGTLTQASYAFSVMESALSLILSKIDEFSSLAAETSRLAALLAALAAADVDGGGRGVVPGFTDTAAAAAGPVAGSKRRTWRLGSKLSQMKVKAADDSQNLLTGPGRNSAEGVSLLSVTGIGDSTAEYGLNDYGYSSDGVDAEASNGCEPAAAVANSSQQHHRGRVLRMMDGCYTGLSVEGLTAWVPGRHHHTTCVCRGLTFSIGPGESLLILGPSGCGKSSLLRVIAGLWTEGSGTIRGPKHETVFFLPQKPFMPLGTLKQQLVFPSACDQQRSSSYQAFAADQQLAAGTHATTTSSSSSSSLQPSSCAIDMDNMDSNMTVEQQLYELLRELSLAGLVVRYDAGFAADVDWAAVLSLGEQQRVALVRLLYHKPELAFLDEATAALDAKTEAAAYSLVSKSCSTYVSVGHRMQLLDWHSHVLVFEGGGNWNKYTVAEYRHRLAAGLEN